MEGTLFKYGPSSANVAFCSGRHRRHVVLVGGLTDGLLALPYTRPLAERLDAQRWSLVQTPLSSSNTGWGLASLDQDAEELLLLATHLKRELSSEGIVIVGHSTGCQDAVRYVQRYCSSSALAAQAAAGAAALAAAAAETAALPAPLLGAVLQGPVSDREWLATQADTPERLAHAEALVKEGRGKEVAFRALDIDGAAVTAQRWCALAAVDGDDDMFSSDFSDGQLQALFRPLQGLPTLVLLNGAEEYVPAAVDYTALGARLVAAIGSSAALKVIEGGNHSLAGKEEEAAAVISGFVSQL